MQMTRGGQQNKEQDEAHAHKDLGEEPACLSLYVREKYTSISIITINLHVCIFIEVRT